jgi:hypothetical protein
MPLTSSPDSVGSTPAQEATATAERLAVTTPASYPSATATSDSPGIPTGPQTSTNTSLTFITDADAWVDESKPDENYGSGESLRTDGESDHDIESFIRFTVTGISGTVQSAQLRVYASTNDSRDGPAVYLTDTSWVEAEITWNTRPTRTGGAIDNKGRIGSQAWVEYNVTSQVAENGTFSFVLAPDSSDGIAFSSRESNYPPELIITLGSDSPSTPTPTLPAGAVVFVGAGDIASCDNDHDEMTAQLLDAIPGTVFTTGDNAYSNGTYAEYIDCYEPTWGRHKARTKPIPGSHEYHTAGAAGYFQYFDNIPSYYAYDLGAWRVYALNSDTDISVNGPQMIWLQSDLAANPRKCILAYWHRPRWSSGSEHGRDPTVQTLWEILYKAGAELVINGHEHNYERFAPMNAAGEPDPSGLREFVVGTGGGDLYDFDTPLPTSEVRDSSTFGVLKLTLHGTGYDWQFIPVAGSTFTDSGSSNCH